MNTVISTSLPRACTVEEVRSATVGDAELQAIINSRASGNWSNPRVHPYYAHRFELTSCDSTILRDNRILIPDSLRKELAHQGHQGIAKTKSCLRSKVWWPGIFVRQCQPCTLASTAPIDFVRPTKCHWQCADILFDLFCQPDDPLHHKTDTSGTDVWT